MQCPRSHETVQENLTSPVRFISVIRILKLTAESHIQLPSTGFTGTLFLSEWHLALRGACPRSSGTWL